MVKFIDDHRGAHGVEPICEMLPIAPATYYEHLAKRADPARLSDRAKSDEAIRPEIERVFNTNWRVDGVRKIWRQLRREGFDVARCTVSGPADEEHGYSGLYPRQAAEDDGSGQEAGVPAGQGEPPVPGASAQHVVGVGVHLRRFLERVRLCCICHRRLCPTHRRLARQHLPSCRVRSRCPSNRPSINAARSKAWVWSIIRTADPKADSTGRRITLIL